MTDKEIKQQNIINELYAEHSWELSERDEKINYAIESFKKIIELKYTDFRCVEIASESLKKLQGNL